MEARTSIETYVDYLDAFHYLETKLSEYQAWEIKDSSGIQYINHGWRVGVSFEKSAEPIEVQMA